MKNAANSNRKLAGKVAPFTETKEAIRASVLCTVRI